MISYGITWIHITFMVNTVHKFYDWLMNDFTGSFCPHQIWLAKRWEGFKIKPHTPLCTPRVIDLAVTSLTAKKLLLRHFNKMPGKCLFLTWWPWPLAYDHDLWTWPRYPSGDRDLNGKIQVSASVCSAGRVTEWDAHRQTMPKLLQCLLPGCNSTTTMFLPFWRLHILIWTRYLIFRYRGGWVHWILLRQHVQSVSLAAPQYPSMSYQELSEM